MEQVQIFLAGRELMVQLISLLEEKKVKESFEMMNEEIPLVQSVIWEMTAGGFVSPEELNRMSQFLIQALENADGVLLYDIVKYAMYDALNQILGLDSEE